MKEKKNIATEKREKIEVRKEKLQNLFLPLDFDKKEDTIVNESSEYAQYQKDRELIVKKIAEHFKVEYKAICNWPDEMILQTAENIFGKVDDEKGKSQSFE